MNLWSLCNGNRYVQSLAVEPWRVVEAQHILSARDLVDTIEEHDILEDLLEASKPKVNKKSNYLIFTPFRYPPLKYGSRFGRNFEPSLWYGSLEIETAFAEVAYYQLCFRQDTSADLEYVETALTAFNTSLKTNAGIDLTEAPFNQYTKAISDKNSYQCSQALGTSMREAGVETCLFFSSRTEYAAKNVAAFTPKVFHKKNNQYVFNQQTWKCIANKHRVEFTRIGVSGKTRLSFTG